jgi:ketosteroid isomerase-like protein
MDATRRTWPAIVALAIGISIFAHIPVVAQDADAKAQKEVRDFLDTYAKAYQNKDINAIMAMIAPDPIPVFIEPGENGRLKGIATIKASYEKDFTEFKSVKYKYDWVSVRAKGDAAWYAADITAEVELSDGKISVPCYWTGVLEKMTGKWLIVQSHLSYKGEEEQEEAPQDKDQKDQDQKGKEQKK